jgi:polyisoprenoid-binding protein YceI
MKSPLTSRTFLPVLLLAALPLVSGCDNDPVAGKTVSQASAPVASAAPSASAPTAARLKFDASSGSVSFVGAKVTGKHDGGFKELSGSVELVEGAPEKSRFDVTLQTASIFTDTEKLTKHLKSPDFFDVERFPTARFISTEIRAGGAAGATHTVVGNLTLHGVEKSISFPATLRVEAGSATIAAEFGLLRKDFGIVYPGMPDDLIKDEVLIKLALTARP